MGNITMVGTRTIGHVLGVTSYLMSYGLKWLDQPWDHLHGWELIHCVSRRTRGFLYSRLCLDQPPDSTRWLGIDPLRVPWDRGLDTVGNIATVGLYNLHWLDSHGKHRHGWN